MRAIAALLVLLGSGCAVAQDSAPAVGPAKPEAPAEQWLLGRPFTIAPESGLLVAARQFSRSQKHELPESSQGSAVCSVKLLEMPIPRDKKFTMRVTRPSRIDDGIYAKAPAPACP
jgi:hypothetical protein